MWKTVGWHLAAVLTLPFLGMLVAGYFLEEWEREDYWFLIIMFLALGFAAILLWPLILVNFF